MPIQSLLTVDNTRKSASKLTDLQDANAISKPRFNFIETFERLHFYS